MRVEGTDCELYFKALHKYKNTQEHKFNQWEISENYFVSKEDAVEYYGIEKEVRWPVEIDPNGYCIVPDQV